MDTVAEQLERALRLLDEQQRINAQMRIEIDVLTERVRQMKAFNLWVYNCSRDALMLPPRLVKEGREARDKALCDINARSGAGL